MAKEEFYTRGYADNYAEFDDPIELDSTSTTRTVFQAHMSDKGIGGEIVRYKLGPDGKSEPIKQNFNNISAGDGAKIKLSNKAVAKLLAGVAKYEEIRKTGISKGIQKYSVVGNDDYVISNKRVATAVRSMVESGSALEFWELLSNESPDVATTLADSKIQQSRRESLAEFETLLSDETTNEGCWQNFFENNKWIFGLGLRYQILKIKETQAVYGGVTVDRKGGQKGDFLTNTQANAKFTCLVEIKKATTELLSKEPYRNGAYSISDELAGAVAQLQANCATWENEGSRLDQNRDIMGDIHTVQPKGLLVIGNTLELAENRDKWSSFERFRQNIQNPEIITFDELKERAEFIVNESDGEYGSSDNDSNERFFGCPL